MRKPRASSRISETTFSGSVWFQERYFLAALQLEMDRAKETGDALAVLLVKVPECSRRAAHHLFLYAEAEKQDFFFGLLSNGDYVVCMPGRSASEASLQREALTLALSAFDACSGMAVLGTESTAMELIDGAAEDCAVVNRAQSRECQPRCLNSLHRLRDH